jgi:hypothetical protein
MATSPSPSLTLRLLRFSCPATPFPISLIRRHLPLHWYDAFLGVDDSEPEQSKPSSVNDHQKTVSGKKQHGPEDKVGADAGGNEGSKGQNVDSFYWHREGAWRHRRQPWQESGS